MRNTLKNSLTKPTFGQVSGAASLSSRISNWRTPVAAAALALTLGLPALDAHALALGRVNVLSAIGEPLRAEIEVPDINADEAASLKASIASGDAFRAAGLEYNSALTGAQISLQRRANGSAYLRLTSDKPVNEPFVDLILETTWATGRVVRDYTMLFDPPNLRAQSAPSVNTAPAIGAAASGTPRASAVPSARAPTTARAPRAASVQTAPAAAASDAKSGSVTVKAGNTATQLAARYKPEGVSLDQMLVAMLNTNPDAFVEGNVNRLKKGAVIDLPATNAAAANVPQEQARQTITAQSKDFNDFRRRLAQGATAAAPTASRKDSGSVQASVKDSKPTAIAPDKLTLSKPSGAASAASANGKPTKEDAIAKDKQAKDTAARTAELSKNIQDLNKFSTPTAATPSIAASSAAMAGATAAAKPAAAASAITLPSVPVAMNAPSTSTTATLAATTITTTATTAATTGTLPAVSATVASNSPTATVTAVITPVEVASAPKPVVKPTLPAPAPEPSFMTSLLDNPFTLPAAGGLLALLAGFGVYRMRQRKNSGQVDSSFLESRLQPDSFFGASGGQRIDTNDAAGAVTGSSMVYSPSQLDAAGDVDPVAEADVYLAYGRDLQAEEILKEAMRTTPTRVAIHAKLMEIYAKRRDVKAFETVANEAYAVTHGQGTEWDAAAALGRELDPSNPLYQGSVAKGAANSSSGALLAAGAVGAAGAVASMGAFAHNTAPQALQAADDKDDVDFDLDLDFSSGDDLTEAPSLADASHAITSPVHVQSTSAMMAQPAVEPSVDLSFDAPSLASSNGLNLSKPDMVSFDKGLNFTTPSKAPTASLSTAPMAINTSSPASSMNALEFDLGDMSLDLPGKAPTMADAELSGDPLDTKLALAQEFREIGDNDGARALAQEVAMEATGALKARAQRMVADLS